MVTGGLKTIETHVLNISRGLLFKTVVLIEASDKKGADRPPVSTLPPDWGLLQNLIRYAAALFLLNLGKIVYNKAMIRR